MTPCYPVWSRRLSYLALGTFWAIVVRALSLVTGRKIQDTQDCPVIHNYGTILGMGHPLFVRATLEEDSKQM
jgi:hypothetical protein